MDDIIPLIGSYLQQDELLLTLYKFTSNHKWKSLLEQSNLLDDIHVMVANALSREQKLSCFTNDQLSSARDMYKMKKAIGWTPDKTLCEIVSLLES